jgi:hypothetical protein
MSFTTLFEGCTSAERLQKACLNANFNISILANMSYSWHLLHRFRWKQDVAAERGV